MSDLPQNWTLAPLGDVCSVLDHKRVPINSKERQARKEATPPNDLFPYYGATGQVDVIDGYLFEGEHVLLGEDGAPFLDPFRDKAYVVDGKFWVNNHAHILKAHGSNRYLGHYLNAIPYEDHVTGTTRPKLTKGALVSIPVLLPPLNEQSRIVERIESLFDEIEQGVKSLRDAKRAIELYRQSLLKSAFEGRLTAEWRAKNLDKLESPDVPIAHSASNSLSWPSVHIQALLDTPLVNGRSVKEREGGFPVLRLTALKGGQIHLQESKEGDWNEDEAEPFLVKRGDVFVSRGNGSKKLVGIGGRVVHEPMPVAFPDTMIRVRLDANAVRPEYFVLVWNSWTVRRQIEAAARTTAGIYKINQGHIRGFMLPLPSLAEQSEIVRILEERLESADALEAETDANFARAEALRQSILKQAFSGQLVPQNPDDEPATILLERIKAETTSQKPKGKTRKLKAAIA